MDDHELPAIGVADGTQHQESEDEPVRLQAFVKHPPSEIDLDKPPNLVCTEHDLFEDGRKGNDFDTAMALHSRAGQFQKSGNPVYAIESFMLYHKAGLYPEKLILDWLASVFEEWHSENGHVSMDKVMGLTPGAGKTPPMKAALIEQLEQDLMIEVRRLMGMFGISIHDAAYMVSARLAEGGWDTTGHKLTSYETLTLVQMFYRKWGKLFKEIGEIKDRHGRGLPEASIQEKRESLSHYPEYSYEHVTKMKDRL